MQDEAGQTLHTNIRRKEAERASGNGEFWWGIGNSLGACVLSAAREAGGSLPVLFSMMLSRPAKADSHAETVWLFDEWRDRDGHLHDMPPHVVCLSRSSSRRYALVCRSASPLTMSDHGAFSPPSKIRSTTALVQGDLDGEQHFPGHYHWGFRAELVEPWFVERQLLGLPRSGDARFQVPASLEGNIVEEAKGSSGDDDRTRSRLPLVRQV
jgi:hypothetical protein